MKLYPLTIIPNVMESQNKVGQHALIQASGSLQWDILSCIALYTQKQVSTRKTGVK